MSVSLTDDDDRDESESDSDSDSPDAAEKFDWSLADGLQITQRTSLKDRIDAALAGAKKLGRSHRFNPNHTKDGTFGAGHGGSPGGGGGGGSGKLSEDDAQAVREHVDAAHARGIDLKVGKGKPSDPAEARAAKKAEATKAHAVSTSEVPKVESVQRGEVVTHRFADPIFGDNGTLAKTYPDPDRAGRWISSRKLEGESPAKTSYGSRGKALRASKSFMADQQREHTQTSLKVVKSVPKAVKQTIDDFRPGSEKGWKVRIKVVTP